MRFCLYPGCPNLVKRGRCAQHTQKRKDRPNAQARRWYDLAAWQRLRRLVLSEEPLCRQCQLENRVTAATDVDHVEPHRGVWERFIDRANLQALCHTCHSRKTQAEGAMVYKR